MIHRPDSSPWQTTTARPEDWRERGRCRAYDPELWHATGHDGGGAQAHAAQKVCWRCPVRGECARWALERPERWGVWGGLTQNQRAVLLGDSPPYDYDAPKPAPRKAKPPSGKKQRVRKSGPIEHGTNRGAALHKHRGEELCRPCLEARRAHDREYDRKRRTKKKQAAA